MRCTNCGMPLSPANTKTACPRCHTSLIAGGQQVMQMPFPPVVTPEALFPPPVQMWEPTSAPTPSLTPPATPVPVPGSFSRLSQGFKAPQQISMEQQYMLQSQSQLVHMPSTPAKTRRTGLFGYFIAALCVGTGGFLLLFVYFMGLSLPTGGMSSLNPASPILTQAVQPSPTIARPSPTTAATATSSGNNAFPGQKYIDNPQMAVAVNPATAQPEQLSTTFTVNQKIYVTFSILPNGENGTVCLSWFLNNHTVTHFSFAAGTARSGYSYAIYGGTGTAYVQIAWANSNTCNNALLAQQVNFTVDN